MHANKMPGCLYDGGSDRIPSCPAAPSPHCNKDHKCEAEGGHQLLTYIKVTSNGCDGCDEEGLSMKLIGDDDVLPTPGCETVGLDHPGKVDYASVGEFHAVEEERPLGWGSCYQVGLTIIIYPCLSCLFRLLLMGKFPLLE